MVDQLEEIKKRIDIVQFINQYVPLKKTGRNFKALCPFHSETVPSFIISPERQIWHCFGACSTGGDIFSFLMKWEGIEFGEAVKELAKQAGVKLVSYKPSKNERQKEFLYEINHLAAEYYHYLLLHHPVGEKALNYILGRGIKKESLVLFKLGYAPNIWEGLQKFLVGKKGYKIEDLEKAGLVIKREGAGGYYDRFRHRLMFPLRDHRGNICGFAGRKIPPEDEKEAKYVNTPETLIYHKSDLLYGLAETSQEIKKAGRAILVEGELDVISSYQAGIKNVVAIKGSALSESQVRLLKRFAPEIVFALDADIAGNEAAKRGIEVADSAGLAIKVVEIKGGKDPDEVAQKNPQLWQQEVEEAVPVYDYFLNSALAKFDPNNGEGKRKIGEELISVFSKISNQIVQTHYVQLLAEKLKVEEEAVIEEIARFKELSEKEKPVKPEEIFPFSEKKSRREVLEEYLLALGFQTGNWLALGKRKVRYLIKTPRFSTILEVLVNYLKKFKTIKSERLVKMLPPELQETFNQLYLLELPSIVEEEEGFREEFRKTILRLEKLNIRQRLAEIGEEIKRWEQESSLDRQKKIDRLNCEFRDLSLKLKEIEKEME